VAAFNLPRASFSCVIILRGGRGPNPLTPPQKTVSSPPSCGACSCTSTRAPEDHDAHLHTSSFISLLPTRTSLKCTLRSSDYHEEVLRNAPVKTKQSSLPALFNPLTDPAMNIRVAKGGVPTQQ
jgi:hypothetical protein